MAFNGSGTFTVDTAGTPVVTNTTISSTMFNAVLTELEVGLSTCVTKDGQTTATASIPFAAGISVTGLTTLNSAVVLNESGGDNDIRMESDANTSHFVSDAGQFSGVGAVGIGNGPNSNAFFTINPPALTSVANQDFVRVTFLNSASVTVPAGTSSIVATCAIHEPNITATGTVTEAASLYVVAAPTEGTKNYALLIASGVVKSSSGSVILQGAALATNATDGFTYIPTCGGAASGVPTAQTGTCAMIYDTTNNKLMVYNGAWKTVTLA